MSETNLYKTVTLSTDQTVEIELALLTRIGQLRARLHHAKDAILVPNLSGGSRETQQLIIINTESELVVAHQALTVLSHGRLHA